MKDQDILAEFNKTFMLMWWERTTHEKEWDLIDAQVEAVTIIDNNGSVRVNIPVEKNVIEFSCGRQAWSLNYNIEPLWETDIQQLMPAKYTLDYFLDDDKQPYQFYNELRKWDYDTAKYGSGIFYNGLTYTNDKIYELDWADSYWDNKYNEIDREFWTFTPRNVSIRSFWVDYMATKQSDFNRVNRCVMLEKVTPEILEMRWGWKKWFNATGIPPMTEIWAEYGETPIRPEEIMLHYRFNRVTKDYWIIANRNTVVYAGKMMYKHWKLPFTFRQYYPNTKYIYWEGIPRRLRTDKAYKNIILQSMLDKSIMSSWINLAVGNNGQVDWELYTSSSEINIWQFTSGIDQVKQIALDSNISSQTNLLTILDDQIIQNSWENIKAPYSSPAGTATEAEILEENKQIRQKTVDQLRDIALDDSLTQVLKNIQQFAPSILCKKVYKEVDGKKILSKVEYPKILIPNVWVKKKRGKLEFNQDLGDWWVFELEPGLIDWELSVRITTTSTKNNLRVLEKNGYTQYIQNLSVLAQINPQILGSIDTEWILQRWNLIYNIDPDWYTATTRKSETRRKNLETIDQLKWMMSNLPANQPTDANWDVAPTWNPTEVPGFQGAK